MDGLSSTHLLSLDALLTVIDSIEHHCSVNTREAVQDTGELLIYMLYSIYVYYFMTYVFYCSQ